MSKLTFAFDCQLNENEEWIEEGTTVKTYNHPLKKEGYQCVMIEWAYTWEGTAFNHNQYEWFMNEAFKELRK